MSQPKIGETIHYTAPGSADGRFPCVCRPALVVESNGPFLASLMVVNPTGVHFREGVTESAGDPADDAAGSRCFPGGDRAYAGFTWHWPERTPE